MGLALGQMGMGGGTVGDGALSTALSEIEIHKMLNAGLSVAESKIGLLQLASGATVMTGFGTGTNQSFEGIYSVKDGVASMLYNVGNWQYLQEVKTGCLISGYHGTVGAIAYYDYESNSASVLYLGSGSELWWTFFPFEDGCIITCAYSQNLGGFWFDCSTKQLTRLSTSSYYSRVVELLDGYMCVVSSGSHVYFKYQTGEKFSVSGDIVDRAATAVLEDGSCLFGSTSQNNKNGVLRFDPTTRQFTTVLSSSYAGWGWLKPVPGGCLMSCVVNLSDIGLYLFKIATKTSVQLTNQSSNYQRYLDVPGGLLCAPNASQTGSGGGLWFYDTDAMTLTQLYATGANWLVDHIRSKSGKIITCGSAGLLSYDEDTRATTPLISTGSIDVLFRVQTGYLGAGGMTGVVYFDDDTEAAIQLYSTGTNWRNFHLTKTGCLIGAEGTYNSTALNAYSTGVLYFDSLTKTIALKHNAGYGWGLFTAMDDYVFIGAKNLSPSPYTATGVGLLRFRESDKSVARVHAVGCGFKGGVPVPSGYLIGQVLWGTGAGFPSNSSMLLRYDPELDSCDVLWVITPNTDIFVKLTDTKVLISGTNKLTSNGEVPLLYDDETRSAIPFSCVLYSLDTQGPKSAASAAGLSSQFPLSVVVPKREGRA